MRNNNLPCPESSHKKRRIEKTDNKNVGHKQFFKLRTLPRPIRPPPPQLPTEQNENDLLNQVTHLEKYFWGCQEKISGVGIWNSKQASNFPRRFQPRTENG
jgi:hypothetical protein